VRIEEEKMTLTCRAEANSEAGVRKLLKGGRFCRQFGPQKYPFVGLGQSVKGARRQSHQIEVINTRYVWNQGFCAGFRGRTAMRDGCGGRGEVWPW